jgi:predicted DCC family thiol-disulfide oxidoreductase YuxK
MKRSGRVANPPPKPLLIYDGDCNFCLRWVKRWRRVTGEHVDYVPLQDAILATRYPELAPAELEAAVHLIEPDGAVFRGAAAALRARATNSRCRLPFWCYEHVPGFAIVAELIYGWVARNRSRISRFTRVRRPSR